MMMMMMSLTKCWPEHRRQSHFLAATTLVQDAEDQLFCTSASSLWCKKWPVCPSVVAYGPQKVAAFPCWGTRCHLFMDKAKGGVYSLPSVMPKTSRAFFKAWDLNEWPQVSQGCFVDALWPWMLPEFTCLSFRIQLIHPRVLLTGFIALFFKHWSTIAWVFVGSPAFHELIRSTWCILDAQPQTFQHSNVSYFHWDAKNQFDEFLGIETYDSPPAAETWPNCSQAQAALNRISSEDAAAWWQQRQRRF